MAMSRLMRMMMEPRGVRISWATFSLLYRIVFRLSLFSSIVTVFYLIV